MPALLSRLTVLGMLLSLIAMGVRPAPVLAQTDATIFDDALLARSTQVSAAGPLAGNLVQSDGFNTVVGSGVALSDFSATATLVNPAESNAPPWDLGFSFRRDGDVVQQLVIDSAGFWYDSPYPAGNEESGFVAGFDPGPGAFNTIDLIVSGDRALFGVNGEFVAGFDLPGEGIAADVEIGTGYFVGSVVDGREIRYQDFEVWPLQAPSVQPTEVPTATSVPPILVPEPTTTIAAADAELFASLLLSQAFVDPVSGPFTANLREVDGVITVAWADVDLLEFHASASAVVPADTGGSAWDAGFIFGTSPSGTLRAVVDSQQRVFFSVGAGAPAVVGEASNLLTNPANTNTFDMFVGGGRALLGVNGELAASFELPADAAAADVGFGSGFYSDQTVADRLLVFDDFTVRPFDASGLGGQVDSTGPTPDEVAEFAALAAETQRVAPLVGPFSGRLVEATVGTVPLAPAGVSLADFGAIATVVNPEATTGNLWDSGFRFRADSATNNRIVIDSLGDVYALLAGEDPRKVATASSFDPSPGASNTLQLFVDGDRALFGVNGALVSVIGLTAAPVASDVQIGTGFFNEDFVVGRVIDYREFMVWEMT